MIDALKIRLGNIYEKNAIIRVLFELTEFVKSDDYSNIEWLNRKLRANEILKKINGMASIINLIPKPH